MAEEVVRGVALPSGEQQAEHDDGGEVRENDRDVEWAQGQAPRKTNGPRRARAEPAVSE